MERTLGARDEGDSIVLFPVMKTMEEVDAVRACVSGPDEGMLDVRLYRSKKTGGHVIEMTLDPDESDHRYVVILGGSDLNRLAYLFRKAVD